LPSERALAVEAVAPASATVAALQDQIRRAGSVTRRLRVRLGGAVLALMLLPSLFALVFVVAPGPGPVYWVAIVLLGLLCSLPGGFLYAALISLPVAGGYRCLRRAQLRRLLKQLPPGEAAAVLTPLQAEADGDTRKLVAPLLRQLRREGTEIVPAAMPDGRGDEASAAD
jgi:hypothetical protein